jgi:hypothetical protein
MFFSALQLIFLFFLQENELRKALIPFIGVSALQILPYIGVGDYPSCLQINNCSRAEAQRRREGQKSFSLRLCARKYYKTESYSCKGHGNYQVTVFEYVGRVSTRQQGLALPPLSD